MASTCSESYSSDTCMFCHEPLRITASPAESDAEVDQSEQEQASLVDDVELYCSPPGSGPGGHHAHWTCLIDKAKQGATPSVFTCFVCAKDTRDASGRFLVDVRNEGGETKRFDFGEILEEELFLDSNPSQVHVRAFHDLIAEGDYVGAIELIAEHDIDIHSTYGTDGLTVLQKAIRVGDTSGVEFLKGLGAKM